MRVDQNFTAIDIPTQPVQHSPPYHGEQSLLGHDAATDDDSLRREREHQLRAKLPQIVRLYFPLGMCCFKLRKISAAARADSGS